MMLRQLISDKVLLLNTSAITASFMDIEYVLKIILLSISILYTGIKIYMDYCKRNDEK